MSQVRDRASSFCQRIGTSVPILLAPMAGACPPALSIAVANAGGLGACGALLMPPEAIAAWASEFRAHAQGPFQINLWIPDPKPSRDPDHEKKIRDFLGRWGPPVDPTAGDAVPPDFDDQCDGLLSVAPPIVSSIMGLYPPDFVHKLKARGILWFANISTTAEARQAEAAGADVIVAQGAESGGHRGSFNAENAERQQVGLFSLLPAVVDAVRVPVVATGGIADPRGVAAALILGASAVQIGTGFLRCPESGIHPAWAAALAQTAPEDTVVTRAFSGRAGRSIATDYVRAAMSADAPGSAPYPIQRGLTAAMRRAALKDGDVRRMQVWAGQSAALARAQPAGGLLRSLWADAAKYLPE
ncbi:MAG TPA: nitronate monooxygenase family protein [Bryobacteraceae bacterium]